jgi:hypothetical protein
LASPVLNLHTALLYVYTMKATAAVVVAVAAAAVAVVAVAIAVASQFCPVHMINTTHHTRVY